MIGKYILSLKNKKNGKEVYFVNEDEHTFDKSKAKIFDKEEVENFNSEIDKINLENETQDFEFKFLSLEE